MCAPYWPDDVGKSLQFNDYIIELVESNKFEDYTQRQFKLTKETVSASCCIINSYMLYLLASKHLVTHVQSPNITTLGGLNMVVLAQVLV